MAIKTKEELFGDDGANGPRVPVSETNPPGTSAANRGVQFGEAVKSDTANRAPYALAENDEDLDRRLKLFESTGLDAAYRAGETEDPEEGRIITLDGGAVETVSELGADFEQDSANAHFRANMLGDSDGLSVGFEVRGKAAAAFLYSEKIGPSRYSNLTTNPMNCTLNDSGSGSNYLTVNDPGRVFRDGSNLTDLIPGFDLVFVTEVVSGLVKVCRIFTIIDQFTVGLRALSGDMVSWGANTAATFVVARMRAANWSASFGSRPDASETNVMAGGGNESPSALILIPGADSPTDPGGAQEALRVYRKTPEGLLRTTMVIGREGELRYQRHDPDTGAETRAMRTLGPPVLTHDVREPNGSGTYSQTYPAGYQAGMFSRFHGGTVFHSNLTTQDTPSAWSGDAVLAGNFPAIFDVGYDTITLPDTPTTGLAALRNLLCGGALLQCVSSSNSALVGFYWLLERSAGSDDTYVLRDINGSTPVFTDDSGEFLLLPLVHAFGNQIPMSTVERPDGSTTSSPPGSVFRTSLDVHGTFRGLEATASPPAYRRIVYEISTSGFQHRGDGFFGGALEVGGNGSFGGDTLEVPDGVVYGQGHVYNDPGGVFSYPTKRIQIPLEMGCPEDNDGLFLSSGTALTVNVATSGASSLTVTGSVPAWLTPGDRLRISAASSVEHIISGISGSIISVVPNLPATFSSGDEIVVYKLQSAKAWRYLDSPPNHSQAYRGWFAYNPRGIIRFPIMLPAQTILTGARVLVWTHARTDDVLAGGVRHTVAGVSRRAVVDFATPTAPSYTAVGATASPPDAGSGLRTLELVTGDVSMDSAHNYYIYVQAGSDGPGSPGAYNNPSLLINGNTDVVLAVEIDVEVIDAFQTSNVSIY